MYRILHPKGSTNWGSRSVNLNFQSTQRTMVLSHLYIPPKTSGKEKPGQNSTLFKFSANSALPPLAQTSRRGMRSHA